MKRTLTLLLPVALMGCGDAGSGGSAATGGTAVGELVVCDEVEVVEGGDGSFTRLLEAVYPGVEEGTATFTFCDFWSVNNGVYIDSAGDCTEGRDLTPGFYRDGDLHVACSMLEVSEGSSLEVGPGASTSVSTSDLRSEFQTIGNATGAS